MAAAIRVGAADDHPMVCAGLAALIGAEPDMTFVCEARDGAEAVAAYRAHRPDVFLMDLSMPRTDGVTATEAIVGEFPAARVVVLTTFDGDADIYRALAAGARGYLLKHMLRDEIVGVIREVHAGRRAIPAAVAGRLAECTPRVELTEREEEVLRLAAKGLRNADIARLIHRTEATVKVHLTHVMRKLGVADRTEAVTTALQRGIIRLD